MNVHFSQQDETGDKDDVMKMMKMMMTVKNNQEPCGGKVYIFSLFHKIQQEYRT